MTENLAETAHQRFFSIGPFGLVDEGLSTPVESAIDESILDRRTPALAMLQRLLAENRGLDGITTLRERERGRQRDSWSWKGALAGLSLGSLLMLSVIQAENRHVFNQDDYRKQVISEANLSQNNPPAYYYYSELKLRSEDAETQGEYFSLGVLSLIGFVVGGSWKKPKTS